MRNVSKMMAAAILIAVLPLGACGQQSSNADAAGSTGSQSSQTDSAGKSGKADTSDKSDSADSSDKSDSSEDSSDASSTPAAPVSIDGDYEFANFGKLCEKDCRADVTVAGGKISVTMVDKYGKYPYWIGSVDEQAIGTSGKWTSKASTDAADVKKIKKSMMGNSAESMEFTYDKLTKSVVFTMDSFSGQKNYRIAAEPVA